MNTRLFWLPMALTWAATCIPALAEPLPVTEVTAFKDGHAFIVREGVLPVDATGDVVVEQEDRPILGTFWSFADPAAGRLVGVSGENRPGERQRPVMNLREILDANPGRACTVTEVDCNRYAATIVGQPHPETTPSSDPSIPQPPPPGGAGQLVLLQTAEGFRAIPLDRIRELTFPETPATTLPVSEQRTCLHFRFARDGAAPAEGVRVGYACVQRGLRWIPSYRVELLGDGTARVKLQATIVNDLADLNDATVRLVIGAPNFRFSGTIDPVSLREALSTAPTQPGAPRQRIDMLANQAIMTQMAMPVPTESQPQATVVQDPGITDAERREELFVYTAGKVTLARGARLVVPIAEVTVPCEDLYVLELPVSPPDLAGDSMRNAQLNAPDADLARLLAAPKVMHRVRLRNTADQPFTTAPALVLANGQVLGQSLLTYAAPGAATEVDVAPVVDVTVGRTEGQTNRVENALVVDGHAYARVDMTGTLTLASHRPAPVRVDVVRYMLGEVDNAGQGGKIVPTSPFDLSAARAGVPSPGPWPDWWYGLPWWWMRRNSVTSVQWQCTLQPGESATLDCAWHYFVW